MLCLQKRRNSECRLKRLDFRFFVPPDLHCNVKVDINFSTEAFKLVGIPG